MTTRRKKLTRTQVEKKIRSFRDGGDGKITLRRVLGRYAVKIGGVYNGLRIMSKCGLWY
jgi:hypothetical protein